MSSRGVRLARGFTAAAVSTLVAAVFHASGGGVFPHFLLLLLGLIFSTLFCVAMTGREVSWARLVASVGFSQVLFHLIFSMTGDSSLQLVQSAGHTQHALAVGDSGGAIAHDVHSNPWMLLAHTLAAIVTIAALRFGESAFRSLFTSAGVSLSFLFRFIIGVPVEVASRPKLTVIGAGFQSRRQRVFLASVQHRGPPLAFVLV